MAKAYPATDWRAWHGDLARLVNGEFPGRVNSLTAAVAPEAAFARGARAVAARATGPAMAPKSSRKLHLRASELQSTPILELRDTLGRTVADDVLSVVFHGSLGTEEVVPYSDVDALVILRSETIADPGRLARTCRALARARRFMYAFDPLQHHGWFSLPEQALQDWPEDYLPVAAIENGACLLGARELKISVHAGADVRLAARRQIKEMIDAIRMDVAAGIHLSSAYQLKSVSSRLMLLPALYVQARDGRGVFKRDSFARARPDFSAEAWSVIEAATRLRAAWPKFAPTWPQVLSTRPGPIGRRWRRHFGSRVPQELVGLARACVDQGFERFADELAARLRAEEAGNA